MSGARKKQQWMMVGIVLGIGAFIFLIASNILGRSPQSLVTGSLGGRIDTRIVADRTSGASPEDIWISNAEVQIGDLAKQIGALQQQLAAAEQKATEADAALAAKIAEDFSKLSGETYDAVTDLAGRIGPDGQGEASGPGSAGQTQVSALDLGMAPPPEFVTRDAAFMETRADLDPGASAAGSADRAQRGTAPRGTPITDGNGEIVGFERAPFVTSFALTARAADPEGPTRRTLDHYVPAGSYAPAIVLTGADAKTGTENLANPIPVVLKLTGPAFGPSDGSRTTRINLEGCRVMGSAVGDLSSERVSVRLDAISCVRGGEVLEASVAGYVSGQGQQGVRGRLFSRAGPAVTNAAIAAALEGVAGAAGGAGQTIIGLDGATGGDVAANLPLTLGAGAAGGAAMRLADYYIDRAEQISPVVSLYAGTHVNVVFLEGVNLGSE